MFVCWISINWENLNLRGLWLSLLDLVILPFYYNVVAVLEGRPIFWALEWLRWTVCEAIPKAVLWVLWFIPAYIERVYRAYEHAFTLEVPYGLRYLRDIAIYSAPNLANCYTDKPSVALYFVDVFYIWYGLYRHWNHRAACYLYVVIKFVTMLLPHVFLIPAQRGAFMLLLIPIAIGEILLVLFMVIARGYGIEWRKAHLTWYKSWPRHFRYKRITGNRRVIVEALCYVYIGYKFFTLFSLQCNFTRTMHVFNKMRAKQVTAPYIPLRPAPRAIRWQANIWSDIYNFGQKFRLCSPRLADDKIAQWYQHNNPRLSPLELVCLIKKEHPWRFASMKHDHFVDVFGYPNLRWRTQTGVEHTYRYLFPKEFNEWFVATQRSLVNTNVYIDWRTDEYILSMRPRAIAPTRWSGLNDLYLVLEPSKPSESSGLKDSSDLFELFDRSDSSDLLELFASAAAPVGDFTLYPPHMSYTEALLELSTTANLQYSLLFILALSSLSVYSIILAGWSSNSKYAFIGALRSAAQMVSYEVAISLILLPIITMSGSLNFTSIVFAQSVTGWYLFALLPVAILFMIAMLAETNRTPFDLPEAEAELVAGYNVDYSALPFAMFFLGEYCNMILISVLFCLLFLGGWTFFSLSCTLVLTLKAAFIWAFFVLVRATLPRYRYDQLMNIGWKVFLPLSGGFAAFVLGVLITFRVVPVSAELPLHELYRFSIEDSSIFCTTLHAQYRPPFRPPQPLPSPPALYFKPPTYAAVDSPQQLWHFYPSLANRPLRPLAKLWAPLPLYAALFVLFLPRPLLPRKAP